MTTGKLHPPGIADPGTPGPVGVRVLHSTSAHSDVPVYHGVSYCDAVRRVGKGESLRVLPGSIEVCGWAPVVLGLKAPDNRFEQGLAPRLWYPVAGLLLAPLDCFPGEPDVVVVRARPEVLRQRIQALGPGALWEGHGEGLDRSAISALMGEQPTWRQGLVGAVNSALAALARYRRWQAFTRWLFRSTLVTVGFDALISRALADMSICRNSTVIPLLTGRVNASFFCTGGVTWGRNDPEHLTSGWPWAQFCQTTRLPGTGLQAERRPQPDWNPPVDDRGAGEVRR
jgi:uncharacterized protein (DUF169 family)